MPDGVSLRPLVAYCLNMHSKHARADGAATALAGSVAGTPFYSDRERAALAWTEAVTSLDEGHVPDSVFEQVRAQFSEEEIATLTLAVAMLYSIECDSPPAPRPCRCRSRRTDLAHPNCRSRTPGPFALIC